MTRRPRKNYSATYKLEAAQLVIEQGYSMTEASLVINVSKSAMTKWVQQLKDELSGVMLT